MNTKDLGMIVEAKFQLMALHKGWIVSQPFGDNAPYDFIVDTGTELLKVQCKHMSKTDDGYRMPCHSKMGHRRTEKLSYRGRVDYMFGVNIADDIHVWIPTDDCPLTEVKFRLQPAMNNQCKGVRLVSEYTL